MDPLDLEGIAEHDQVVTALKHKADEITGFYRSLVEGGLPSRLAGRIVLEWTDATLDAAMTEPTPEPRNGDR
jgi:hypothetical protein